MVSGTQATGIGAKNSFRYRGYYYDTETGLHYLRARYYDPVTGSFISADDVSNLGVDGELNGYNLYAYCGNNPVMGMILTVHLIYGDLQKALVEL